MKIKNIGTLNKQHILSKGTGKKMRLSENASTTVFKMFTKSVYSNPIGKFITDDHFNDDDYIKFLKKILVF